LRTRSAGSGHFRPRKFMVFSVMTLGFAGA